MDDQPRYQLRRTLFPWQAQETIDEAVRFATEFGLDEVVWKIDTEEFSHGLPTLERIDRYLPWLRQARERLAVAGVAMSINPWVTLGMRDAGLNNRADHPDFGWMVDISGVAANTIACPLSPAWRDWLTAAFLRYASCGPRVVWIEDDIRVHGHRPVTWGCFCDHHLQAFGARVGRHFTREELAAEVLRPGPPSEIREAWLHFEGEAIEDTLRQVAAAVYGQYPAVRLGLMVSAPWFHAMELRHWDVVYDIVRGPHEAMVMRPCMGNYQEESHKGLYDSWHLVSGDLAAVPGPVYAASEVEDHSFTRYAKSTRFVRAQLLLSAALGCQAMTLNLYDHVGTPLYAEPEYGVMLRAARPRIDALVAAYGPGGEDAGLGTLLPLDGGLHKRLREGEGYGALSMSRESWSTPLQALGLAVAARRTAAVAVSGHRLEAYADQLDDIFAGGVLLDVSAVESLQALLGDGAARLLGARLAAVHARITQGTPAEEPTDDRWGLTPGTYMTVDHLGQRARLGLFELHGAQAVSHLVNPDREPVQPGFLVYENELGGRVAICPYDLTHGPFTWFCNWHRRRQLHALAAWLCRGPVPLSVEAGAWALPLRMDYPDRILVSVLNLSSDDWDGLTITVHNPRGAAPAVLNEDGTWQPVELVAGRLAWPGCLRPLDMLTVRC